MPSPRDLPEDVESLKRLVLAQHEQLQDRELLIEHLKLQIARLRRAQYGRSSEQLDAEIAQLELTLEDLEVSAAPSVMEPETVTKALAKPVRRPLPSTLPRETITQSPACTCPDCGGALRSAGEDVAEMLE